MLPWHGVADHWIALHWQVWIASYVQALHPGASRTNHFGFMLTTVALAVLTVVFPFMGLLSDRVGRLRLMMVGAVLLVVATPTLCSVLPAENTAATWAAMMLLTLAMALYGAPLPAWTVACFPKEASAPPWSLPSFTFCNPLGWHCHCIRTPAPVTSHARLHTVAPPGPGIRGSRSRLCHLGIYIYLGNRIRVVLSCSGSCSLCHALPAGVS